MLHLPLWDLYSLCRCHIRYHIKANRVSVKSKRNAVSRSVGDTLRQYYTAMPFDAFGSRAIQYCSALTLQVRGVVDMLSNNTLCLVCNLFALSPALIPLWDLRFASDFKVTFLYGFRLFVFVYALHSVVKPTHASVFITSLRFIQTIASLKGFDRTIRSITRIVLYTSILHARQATAEQCSSFVNYDANL